MQWWQVVVELSSHSLTLGDLRSCQVCAFSFIYYSRIDCSLTSWWREEVLMYLQIVRRVIQELLNQPSICFFVAQKLWCCGKGYPIFLVYTSWPELKRYRAPGKNQFLEQLSQEWEWSNGLSISFRPAGLSGNKGIRRFSKADTTQAARGIHVARSQVVAAILLEKSTDTFN